MAERLLPSGRGPAIDRDQTLGFRLRLLEHAGAALHLQLARMERSLHVH